MKIKLTLTPEAAAIVKQMYDNGELADVGVVGLIELDRLKVTNVERKEASASENVGVNDLDEMQKDVLQSERYLISKRLVNDAVKQFGEQLQIKYERTALPHLITSTLKFTPNCTFKLGHNRDGFTLQCISITQNDRAMMLNLHSMLKGGALSCAFLSNDSIVCLLNLITDSVSAEVTEYGICFSWVSSNKQQSKDIQTLYEWLDTMLDPTRKYTCAILMNYTPICVDLK